MRPGTRVGPEVGIWAREPAQERREPDAQDHPLENKDNPAGDQQRLRGGGRAPVGKAPCRFEGGEKMAAAGLRLRQKRPAKTPEPPEGACRRGGPHRSPAKETLVEESPHVSRSRWLLRPTARIDWSAWVRPIVEQLDTGVIADPAVLQQYELGRAAACYDVLQRVSPAWTAFMALFGGFNLVFGLVKLQVVMTNFAPILITFCSLQAFKHVLKDSVKRDPFSYGIAAQLIGFVSNMAIRGLTADSNHTLQQHRAFYVMFVTIAMFQTLMGYLPDRVFNFLVCPTATASWLVYHIRVNHFDAGVVVLGVAFACMMAILQSMTNAAHKRNFLVARELDCVRSSLEQVMSAQQSVLSTFFDASCVCNGSGEITKATPQMTQLLSCDENSLVGKQFVGLLSPEERKRVTDFLRTTWKNGVAKTAMIQATFRRLRTSCCSQSSTAAAPDSDVFEARIHCIRLSGASAATPSMNLWAHGGIFLGLQEVSDSFQTQQNESGTENVHQIVFDAGSTCFEVVSVSPVFKLAGLERETCGLLDMVPRNVRDWLEQYVVNEVQSDTLGGNNSKVLKSLSLTLPTSPRVHVDVRSAWLEFKGFEHIEAEIPVALQLSGLQVRSAGRRPRQRGRQPLAPMDPIQEGSDQHLSEDSASSAGESECSDASTLFPDDSFSQKSEQCPPQQS